MMARFKTIWQSINASYWFLPAVFSLLALAAATATLWLDRNGWSDVVSQTSWLQPARPDGAINMLTVIAGTMIGVASTVFSITIASVAYASGNYGPRLLTNFMEDRGNQFSLATFIGTFVYAITVLRAVRKAEETPLFATEATGMSGFVPQISLLTAFVLMLLSIAVLVYFLNHVPASIRVNAVLEGIGARLMRDIKRLFPDENRGERSANEPAGTPIIARETGYIQAIEYAALERIARRENGKLNLAVRTGDFVHPSIALAYWADMDGIEDCPDDEVRACFGTGAMRTPAQDMQFLIDELVEIGLRALSPGINDPFTAVTAVHWLGAATAELARRNLTRSFAEEGEEPHLVLLDDDFEHYLARGFGAIRSGVATNRIATLVMFDALVDATTTLDDESRRAAIRQEGERLVRQAREHLAGPELLAVEARYQTFINAVKR